MTVKKILAIMITFVILAATFTLLSFSASTEESLNPRWEENQGVWDQKEGATGYEIILYWCTWQPVLRETVTDSSFDFTQYLHPGYNYSFAVRWIKGEEAGDFESVEKGEIPGEPVNITLYYEPESNYVYWEPVEGAEYYDLWICDGEEVSISTAFGLDAEITEYNASEVVYNNGNGSYTALISAYKDGRGNEFARGKAEPAQLSITQDDFPSLIPSELTLEVEPGETGTSGNVLVKLGGKYIHSGNSYLKFEITGEDADKFFVDAFGPYNYAELYAAYNRAVSSVQGTPPGEYHAVLNLFYDPSASGKHWKEAGSCALTLIVKSEESGMQTIESVKCTFQVPESGAKIEKAVSAEPDKYSVASIWLDASAPDQPLSEDAIFEAGKDYILRVSYQANPGFEFAADAVYYANDMTAEDFFIHSDNASVLTGALWRFKLDAPATAEPQPTDEPQATDEPLTTDAPAVTDVPVNSGTDAPDNDTVATAAPESGNNVKEAGGNKLGLGILIGIIITLGVLGIGAALFFILKKRGVNNG